MAIHQVLDEIYESFLAHAAEAHVILIHARSKYRTALLSRILSQGDVPTFYYAMGNDDVDISSFIAGFSHDLADQHPTFGNHVNMALARDADDIEAVLEGFIADLAEISGDTFWLVLDEYDRADIGDALEQFIELLAEKLPSASRLIINSRSLPRLPWMALIAQRKAVMMRDASLVSSDFYDNQAKGDVRLTVTGFSPGRVILDGTEVSVWEGHLPRLLLFFALERPIVTRSEICGSFWTDLSTDQAVNVFHVTKRRLHKALDSIGLDILIHEGGIYYANAALEINYDVVDFVSALVEGRLAGADRKTALAAYQRAEKIYSRPFLQGHNEGWIMRRRADYQVGLIEALSQQAKIRWAENRPEAALTLLTKALGEDNRRQDLHRETMALYADMGRRSEAASHFNRLSEELSRLGIAVEPATVALYNDLMQ